jgi:hypothetical protein
MNPSVFIVVQVGVYRHNIVPQWFSNYNDAVAQAVRLCETNVDTYHHYEIFELKSSKPDTFSAEDDAYQIAEVRATFNAKTQERKIHVHNYPS